MNDEPISASHAVTENGKEVYIGEGLVLVPRSNTSGGEIQLVSFPDLPLE